MAATAYVAVVLISSGLYPILKKNFWAAGILLSLYVGTAIWLAAAASLWPFYVLAGLYAVALVVVVIAAMVKAYADAEETHDYS